MRGLARLAGAGLVLAALLAPAAPARAQDDPAVQRGVPAEATAANAVLARERAIANAQRLAYQRYAAATGANPNASPAQIESLVTSMVVEQERSTLNGYSGRYTIRFRGAGSSSSGGAVAAAPGAGVPNGAVAGGMAGAVPPLGGPVAPAPGAAPSASPLPPGVPPVMPLTAYLDAGARFYSFAEYLALRQRLLAQPSVGSLDVLALSVDGARLRIGLRSPPAVAAPELAQGGILLQPAQPPAANGLPVPTTGPGWRVGLAGGA
ncbi:hypothetical protein EAH89_03160 [Roseomonas nepalensis]|uniref:Uncharacterized protein n=1 Tax=Muricoccus nepalensis TaxID=1854500 RepID=A0A502GI28_9PROT|nr:hypothetical protein [Roseomonas nepalensis]TPG60393.1 hypothetical protein EAH89_03160 [Roseomonas nepalensis]